MNILLVEDEPDVADTIRLDLSEAIPSAEVAHAVSRDSAIAALEQDEFDLLICDLKIPAQGGLDADDQHGLAVVQRAAALAPGLPCIVFTGVAGRENMRRVLSSHTDQDLFGTGSPEPMVTVKFKDEWDAWVLEVKTFGHRLVELDEFSAASDGVQLDTRELRALGIYMRRLGGTTSHIRRLGGGRSGAKTVGLTVVDNNGNTRANVFAKIANWSVIADEKARYHRWVSPLLRIGTFPQLAGEVVAGVGKASAIFYRLVEPPTRSLFEVVQADDELAARLVERLRGTLRPWCEIAQQQHIVVGELRRQRSPDEKIPPLGTVLSDVDWRGMEASETDVPIACQHGDLHGLNVLVSSSEQPLLIDFGDVGEGLACSDPVILEMSLLFLEDAALDRQGWPTSTQAENFFDLDRYLDGCPFPAFVRACRAWSIADAGDERTLAVSVYAHAVRQLKYEDTDRSLAVSIAKASVRSFLG